jgi:hypothetical protein
MLRKKKERATAKVSMERHFLVPYDTLHELKAVLKASTLVGQTNSPKTTAQQTTQEGSFQEAWGRKRHATDETAGT